MARRFPQLVPWSALGRLHDIRAPVLLVNGRADKVTDAVTAPMFMEIPRCKWVTLDASSHMPFWEERERFMGLVDRWLRAEEQGQPV
jgi:pimeloyl-ACP methyl ester carboxylesterase